VAPWLAPYLQTESRARAYLYAAKIIIAVQDTYGRDLISPVTETLSAQPTSSSASETQTYTLNSIPCGQCVFIVTVYGNLNSTIPTATARKEATIIAGETASVDIYCKPYSYSYFSIGNTLLCTSTTANSEYWYSLPVENSDVISITQTNAGTPSFLFDQDGNLISALSATAYGYAVPATDSGHATVYVGVAFPSVGLQSKITTSYVSYSPKNEGSLLSPMPLTLGVSHTITVGPYNRQDCASYYCFTTTDSGYYCFYPSSMTDSTTYSAYIYSDSGFSAQLTSASLCNGTGAISRSLSAATTYYLKVVNNNSSYSTSFAGAVVLASSLTCHNEGISASGTISPVALTLGTGYLGTVGTHAYDDSSYYSFTTDGLGGACLSVTGSSSTDESLYFYVKSDTDFSTNAMSNSLTVYKGSTATCCFTSLSPNTKYYLKVTDYTKNASDAYSFTLKVSGLTPTTLSLSTNGSYTSGSITDTTPYVCYRVPITAGNLYTISWDDSYSGSGTYSLDTLVSAYSNDGSTSYFLNADSGYTSGSQRSFTATSQYVIIVVTSFNTGRTGSFGIRISTATTGAINVNAR
jgi:hypothetical protein